MKSSRVPPPPAEEDKLLVMSSLIHDIMLVLLQRDIRTIQALPLKMAGIYVRSLDQMEQQTSRHLRLLRRELRIRGIRITGKVSVPGGIKALFKCRGYDGAEIFSWETLRSEAVQRLAQYSGQP